LHEAIRTLIKSMIPAPLLSQIRLYRQGGHGADGTEAAAASEFKRKFFWAAFKVLAFNGIEGDYVEFGSHGGRTFRLAFDQIRKRKVRRHMWAFDSFQGLPDASSEMDRHPNWKKGAMATDVASFHRICHLHGIPGDAYTVVQGFYEETLAKMPNDAPPTNIALAFIDCDMYSSTKTVLEFLAPRLKHGMILAFDDYFCYSADQISGERRALLNVLASNTNWNLARYLDCGWAGVSFVVERADLTAHQARSDISLSARRSS